MRWMLLPIIAAVAGCPYTAAAQTLVSSEAVFAIENPLRPGARSPHCVTLTETFDGCTFHTHKDDVNRGRLSVGPGETWVATPSDPEQIEIREGRGTSEEDVNHQIIELIPTQPLDADVTVTFDKLTGEPGNTKVIERRRVTVMIHAS